MPQELVKRVQKNYAKEEIEKWREERQKFKKTITEINSSTLTPPNVISQSKFKQRSTVSKISFV